MLLQLLIATAMAVALVSLLVTKMLPSRTSSDGAAAAGLAGCTSRRQQLRSAAAASGGASLPAAARFVPFRADFAEDGDVMVVDCTHPRALTLTHHKNNRNPPPGAMLPADTSTGLVLNALQGAAAEAAAATATSITSAASAAPATAAANVAAATAAWADKRGQAGPLGRWMGKPLVSCNHFDGDALLAAWAYLEPEHALQNQRVLRHAARIGDFREAALGGGRHEVDARRCDGVVSHQEAHAALKLACWISSEELARFTAPFNKGSDFDDRDIFAHFLTALPAALDGLQAVHTEVYGEVVDGWQLLEDGKAGGSVERHEGLGLAVLRPPRPLHYYSLYSHAIGCDVVACIYPGQRYEVECRYTQFVNVHSRAVHPRLDLRPLASALNELDTSRQASTSWAAPSFADSGPLLRLDRDGVKLSKAERYGHPRDRPIFRSGLPRADFEMLVVSFFEHGLRGLPPKVGGWGWDQLHKVNRDIDWGGWRAAAAAKLAA